ncbi:MAG TPA: AraC family transcriptional regulator, partial [Polyangiales bacterium]
ASGAHDRASTRAPLSRLGRAPGGSMSGDVLSDVLRAVRLTGAVFFRMEGSAPWVAEAPPGKLVAPHVMPGADHVIEYHVVTRGSCYGYLLDGPPLRLRAGDVIVFPQGDPHVLASAPGMRSDFEGMQFYRGIQSAALPIAVSLSPPGADSAQIICGFLGCDAQPFNPLLATLPRVIHIPRPLAAEGAALEPLIRIALGESVTPSAGSQSMLARLSELLFIEVVRRYLSTLPSETKGWLAGLRDELVGRALGALHERPTQAWSLEELARQVGASRSVLAERFHHFVGVPPMQYLARWRMQLAASLLGGTSLGLSQVAERVGYGSEAAFSRAFKRLIGVAPSAWREGLRPPVGFVSNTDDEA